MLQGKAIDQAGATGRTAMQIEMAEKELDWQEKMFNAEQKLAQDKFDQQKKTVRHLVKMSDRSWMSIINGSHLCMQIMREDCETIG